MKPKNEKDDSTQKGGTGNLPVPCGNLPHGRRRSRRTARLFIDGLWCGQVRQASGPTERAGSPCHRLQVLCPERGQLCRREPKSRNSRTRLSALLLLLTSTSLL